MSGDHFWVKPMKTACAVISLVVCFCFSPAFAESSEEACEDWAVKENVDAADKAEYVEDCVDELGVSDADAAMETEESETDYSAAEEQYSEPELEPEPGVESDGSYEEY